MEGTEHPLSLSVVRLLKDDGQARRRAAWES